MANSERGSVSNWLQLVKAGDSQAAEQLWNRYFSQLVQLALTRLRSISQRDTAEDVALSAFKSAVIGIQRGEFPLLTDRNGLWPLLVTITSRKSNSELRRQLAGKRSKAWEVDFFDVQNVLGTAPTAEFAVEFADELERLWKNLNDPALQFIVERKLEGYSHEEIAQQLKCSPRTIIRKLNRIRREWIDGSKSS